MLIIANYAASQWEKELKICVELQGLSLFCGLILCMLWVAMVLPTHPTYHDLSFTSCYPTTAPAKPAAAIIVLLQLFYSFVFVHVVSKTLRPLLNSLSHQTVQRSPDATE